MMQLWKETQKRKMVKNMTVLFDLLIYYPVLNAGKVTQKKNNLKIMFKIVVVRIEIDLL